MEKSGTGVKGELTINAGLDGSPSTMNTASLRLQSQAGGGGTVETVIAQDITVLLMS